MENEWAVVVLAAGYGTRLVKDIRADPAPLHKPLQYLPKALLPIGGAPLLNHWMNQFKACPLITQTYLVTNEKFHEQFVEWSTSPTINIPSHRIINNHTKSNENRNGAVVDLKLVTDTCAEEIGSRHVLCVASDLLLYDDFSLADFLATTMAKKDSHGAILYYNVSSEDAKKRGVVTTDESGRISTFREKPQDSNENRNGAVVDLKLVTDTCAEEIGSRHVLCVASDLLLYDDFSLADFLATTMAKKDSHGAILYYNVSSEDAKKRGVVTTDESGRISTFREKPQDLDEGLLHKASPAFYAYR